MSTVKKAILDIKIDLISVRSFLTNEEQDKDIFHWQQTLRWRHRKALVLNILQDLSSKRWSYIRQPKLSKPLLPTERVRSTTLKKGVQA